MKYTNALQSWELNDVTFKNASELIWSIRRIPTDAVRDPANEIYRNLEAIPFLLKRIQEGDQSSQASLINEVAKIVQQKGAIESLVHSYGSLANMTLTQSAAINEVIKKIAELNLIIGSPVTSKPFDLFNGLRTGSAIHDEKSNFVKQPSSSTKMQSDPSASPVAAESLDPKDSSSNNPGLS